jgi:hypothetical protein
MAKTAKQTLNGRQLGEIIASTLTSGYVPTFSRPELQEMANAYDAAMAGLGRSERAWRGSKAA